MRRNYGWWVRGRYHAELAVTSIASVRKADPGASCSVMVDLSGGDHLDLFEGQAGGFAADFGHMAPMLANLEAIWQLLATVAYGEELVMLDTDTIALRPVALLDEASLAVTWRDHVRKTEEGEKLAGVAAQMPYNFGVIAFRADRYALEAALWMRERVRRLCGRWRTWYGNQIALAELLGPAPAARDRVDVGLPWSLTEYGGAVHVNRHPCEEWNYTPAGAGEDIAGRGVLHFKGHARALMGPYAEALGLPWRGPEQEKAA